MKETLTYYGYGTEHMGSPRGVIQVAYQAGMIDDEAGWRQVLKDRNTLSHVYDETIALDVVDRSRMQHLALFDQLLKELRENWPVDDAAQPTDEGGAHE